MPVPNRPPAATATPTLPTITPTHHLLTHARRHYTCTTHPPLLKSHLYLLARCYKPQLRRVSCYALLPGCKSRQGVWRPKTSSVIAAATLPLHLYKPSRACFLNPPPTPPTPHPRPSPAPPTHYLLARCHQPELRHVSRNVLLPGCKSRQGVWRPHTPEAQLHKETQRGRQLTPRCLFRCLDVLPQQQPHLLMGGLQQVAQTSRGQLMPDTTAQHSTAYHGTAVTAAAGAAGMLEQRSRHRQQKAQPVHPWLANACIQ